MSADTGGSSLPSPPEDIMCCQCTRIFWQETTAVIVEKTLLEGDVAGKNTEVDESKGNILNEDYKRNSFHGSSHRVCCVPFHSHGENEVPDCGGQN